MGSQSRWVMVRKTPCADTEREFHKPQPPEGIYISPEEIQAQFDLLRDLSQDQMTALNNRVLKKIDWHTMPCVTLMFLMKYVLLSDVSMVPSN